MNKHDFRIILNEWLIFRKEAVAEGKSDLVKQIDKAIHERKLRYRQYERDYTSYYPYKVVMRGESDDGESFWEKRLFPEARWADDEIEEYIESEWIYIRSAYDCTGKVFTWRISVFNTPKGVVAYHFYALDV